MDEFENVESKDVTELLIRVSSGDEEAHSELMQAVYDELHRCARFFMRRERPDHTLQATALVHEAYIRLVRQKDVQWQNRAQFYAVAAQLMRRILVDYARNRQADKRMGNRLKLTLDEALEVADRKDLDILLLDEALSELAKFDPRQSRIVELRFFSGLSVEETAEVLGISTATVMREWRIAKMWLYSEINRSEN